jgi:hypothetical protein
LAVWRVTTYLSFCELTVNEPMHLPLLAPSGCPPSIWAISVTSTYDATDHECTLVHTASRHGFCDTYNYIREF